MQRKPNTSKKYEFVGKSVLIGEEKYYQVRILRKCQEFSGGYRKDSIIFIGSSKNLSQIGCCAIDFPAGRSVVTGSADHTYRQVAVTPRGLSGRIRRLPLRGGYFRYLRS